MFSSGITNMHIHHHNIFIAPLLSKHLQHQSISNINAMSKLSTFVTLLTLLQQSACLALPPVKSSGSVITPRGAHSQAGLLKIPVSKSTENFSVQKRQDSATLYNEGPFYFIDSKWIASNDVCCLFGC